MSQWFSAYIIPWEKFQAEWESYSKDKNSYDDFWCDQEFTFYDLLNDCGENYKWQSGWSHDYAFGFHSFLTVDFGANPVPSNYKAFCGQIKRFLCEGSPDVFDLKNEKLRWMDIIYSLYSPTSVAAICEDWEDFDWLSIKDQYEAARTGDFDYERSKEIVEDWIELFRTAKVQGHGVITLLS